MPVTQAAGDSAEDGAESLCRYIVFGGAGHSLFWFPGYYTAFPPRLPASLFEDPAKKARLFEKGQVASYTKPMWLCDCQAKGDAQHLDVTFCRQENSVEDVNVPMNFCEAKWRSRSKRPERRSRRPGAARAGHRSMCQSLARRHGHFGLIDGWRRDADLIDGFWSKHLVRRMEIDKNQQRCPMLKQLEQRRFATGSRLSLAQVLAQARSVRSQAAAVVVPSGPVRAHLRLCVTYTCLSRGQGFSL